MDLPYVRKLTSAQDQEQFAKIMAAAFVYSFDKSSFKPRTKEELAQSPEVIYGYGDPVTSGMVIHDFDVWFDGSLTRAAGVGGVCSLPESRNSGGIQAIFRALLPEWYRDGYTFSMLYPFSHSFYRKYGYELIQESRIYKIPIRLLERFPRDVSPRLVTDFHELQAIREEFGRRNNLSIQRKDSQWPFLSKDPLKDKVYTYALGDEAFFTFVPEAPASASALKTLMIKDLAYRDNRALMRLLGFLYDFRSQYDTADLMLPASVPLPSLVDECYEISQEIQPNGMARIVNVTKALRQMRYPASSGRFTVFVTDPLIAENNGVFRITYADTKATSVLKIADDPSGMRPEDNGSSIQIFSPVKTDDSLPKMPTLFPDEQPTGFMRADDWGTAEEPLASYMTHTSSASLGFLADADSKKAAITALEKEQAVKTAEETAKAHISDGFISPVDLSCSIQVLTQLVLGSLSIDQALYLPRVRCTHPAMLRQIFRQKDIYFSDRF
ncbi:MAG: GNAT family N-acetyltransferase [Firmicutes bacterium]|nr:GNAT family N-acetyltransferase [Bacillota bacterium]